MIEIVNLLSSGPAALRLWAYISGKSLVPHVTTMKCIMHDLTPLHEFCYTREMYCTIIPGFRKLGHILTDVCNKEVIMVLK